MLIPHEHSRLRISVSFGALTPQLGELLARQRAEEPECPVQLVETTVSDQAYGLLAGHYAAGFSVAAPKDTQLEIVELWQDEMAVALPVKSPLLAYSEVPLKVAAQYPLVMWSAQDCAAISERAEALLGSTEMPLNVVTYAK